MHLYVWDLFHAVSIENSCRFSLTAAKLVILGL